MLRASVMLFALKLQIDEATTDESGSILLTRDGFRLIVDAMIELSDRVEELEARTHRGNDGEDTEC